MFESVLLTVTIVMLPPERIHDYCQNGARACYKPALNTVYVMEPRGLHDSARLRDLGEEIYHALGFRHE